MRDTIEYFATPHVSFWRWEDQGQLVTWWDGRTIAFKQELSEGLQSLASRGLPPLGSLLLVYAACRQNWEEDPSRERQLAALSDYLSAQQPLLESVGQCLKVVHEAWKELRDLPHVKARLADAIFDAVPEMLAPHKADDLITVLGNPELLQTPGALDNAACRATLMKSLGTIHLALHGVTVEQLCLRVRTGIDSLPQSDPEPAQPQASMRSLLSALENDDELAGVARLARLVLASLNLPRAVSDPDELPDGGLSDISNRGTLDRLLLSELAHDDLTLSVRIALREALYLRREAPPRTPPRQRVVLVDCGLRLWGVPRVFATAVGLAVLAGSEAAFEVATWRTAPTLAKSDLTTRGGIVAHLEALDHRAHPGAALEVLSAQLSESGEAPELVVITSEDTLGDHEFLAALAKQPLSSLFIATVNREGRYRLQSRSPSGMRLLKEANFDLEEVLARRPKHNAPLKTKHGPEELPAIFHQQRFPLLLSAGVHCERSWHLGKYVYSLPRDGRLLRWSSPDRGAEQIAEGLPVGHVHWVDSNTDHLRFVVGPLRKTGLHLVNMAQDLADTDEPCDIVPLRLHYEHPRAVAGYAGTVFVIYQHACEAFDATTGLRLGERTFEPGLVWKRGRFFAQMDGQRGMSWLALVWQGQTMRLHPFDKPFVPLEHAAVIDAPTPVVVDADCKVLWPSGEVWKFGDPAYIPGKVTAVSRTGRFFLYRGELRSDPAPVLVDLEKRTIATYRGAAGPFLEPLLGQFARPRTLRHRFRSIAIDGFGQLVLFSPSGEAWPIYSANAQIALPKKSISNVKCRERINFVSFEGFDSPYNLQIARWPDGSQAVLDGRGLLHLRSANRSIPECTIVLCEGETAGWASDGRMWGPKYFLGERHPEPAHVVWKDIVAAFNLQLL